MKIIVSQIGAREHYAVARTFQRQKKLAALVTDWYAFEKLNRFQHFFFTHLLRNRGASALAARSDEIPDNQVHAFLIRSFFWKWRIRQFEASGCKYQAFMETDSAFGSAVARLALPSHNVFFGYSYASLEMLEVEKKRGVFTILDQIDPGAEEFRLVAEEMSRFPELAGQPTPFPEAYYARNRREWELADVILVNSEWSREALIRQGVTPEKLKLIPLCYENVSLVSGFKWQPSKPKESKFRILWLGQVNVRKGIHYLMESARLLKGEKVHFDVVGPIGISAAAQASAPGNLTFHGPAGRDRATEWYRQSDLFVLPTLSDGFALTQLEALAHGLPVITTPNCGRVVEEGKTGFIIPPGDASALTKAILLFIREPELAKKMAPACFHAVKDYSIELHGQRLADLLKECSHAYPFDAPKPNG